MSKPGPTIDPQRLYEGEFVVVETDTEHYIGVLSYPDRHTIKITTGLVGRPRMIDVADVELLAPVGHPEVADKIAAA